MFSGLDEAFMRMSLKGEQTRQRLQGQQLDKYRYAPQLKWIEDYQKQRC